MASEPMFKDFVAVVVGGGLGLGRQYCLDLAAAGAQVLVAGRGESAAAVAEEIRHAGGSARACIADVREGERIVAATLAAFGRLDGMIVNAGILRDHSFGKMPEEDWKEIFDVHVHGTFSCVRAAWPLMREQRHGQIVLTTTSGALYPSFGQSNYLSAKGAIISMTQALALEGAPRGIRVNAVAPIAMTRLTAGLFDERKAAAMPVEAVSPFVLALLHPDCPENGATLEVGGGWAAKVRWERSLGRRFPREDWAAAAVLAGWDDVVRFDERATHPTTPAESVAACMGEAPEPR
jgi:NAD(P)-dependent dehydrogenase (short-subunit alcohol dehydrogenase family)